MASNLRPIKDPQLAARLTVIASMLDTAPVAPISALFPSPVDASPRVDAPAAETPHSSAAGNPVSEASDTKSPVLPGDAQPPSAPRSDRRSDPAEGSAKVRGRPARQSLTKPAARSRPKAAETAPERVIGAPGAVAHIILPARRCGKTAHEIAAQTRPTRFVATCKAPETRLPPAPDWITERRAKLDGAIAYLKTLGIIVQVWKREELVRLYLMTGNLNRYTAEQVIGRAERLGWDGGAQ